MTDTARPEAPEELHRVVIRFAGDSGDGMQLTGDRFTSVSALFGNDLSTLPEFPAEIRAPAGTLAGVSAFQVHISDHDITTPGDAPNVLVAMNPAALQGRPRPARAGRHADRQHRHVRRAQPRQGRATPTNPLERRQPQGLHGVRGADDLAHQGGHGAARREAPRRRPLEELLRARPRLVDVHPPGRADARRGSTSSSRKNALVLDAEHGGVQGRATTSVRPPSCSTTRIEVKPAKLHAGRRTRTSPATPRWRGASWPPASSRSCRCSSAATRSRRRPTSSTSCRSTRTSACARSRPRTRSPPSARRSAPPSPATSASPPRAVRAWR